VSASATSTAMHTASLNAQNTECQLGLELLYARIRSFAYPNATRASSASSDELQKHAPGS
jgi:hypothetical protein